LDDENADHPSDDGQTSSAEEDFDDNNADHRFDDDPAAEVEKDVSEDDDRRDAEPGDDIDGDNPDPLPDDYREAG
jgi:hypothetical protein